ADASVTPRGSARNSPDATPKCSPMMPRKRDDESASAKKMESAPPLKPASSAMENYARRDSLSASDATEKRKTPTPNAESAERAKKREGVSSGSTEKPDAKPKESSTAGNALKSEAAKDDSQGTSIQPKSPAPSSAKTDTTSANTNVSAIFSAPEDKKEIQPQNLTSSVVSGDTSQSDRSRASSRASRSSARSRSSSPAVKNAQKSEQPKNALPIFVTTSIENQSDKEAAKEPTVDVVIPLNVLKVNYFIF
ncbi:hypothetical protein TELCIR_22608, partial [Teladorsagia circumcincta]